MLDATSQPRPLPALCRSALLTLLVAGLAACGGGGGGLPPAPDPVYVDGLAGRVLLGDHDLGRIVEQEPNDVAAQGFRLPPVWPRCVLEVTGELGTSAAHRGRADPTDVLLLSVVVDQRIDLQLDFLADDPISLAANDFGASVRRRATGVTVGVTGSGFPRSLDFEAVAGEVYEITLAAAFGHGWYVLRCEGHDLPAAPPPQKALLAQEAFDVNPDAARAPSRPRARRCAAEHVLVRFTEGCDPETACASAGMHLGRRTASGSYRVHVAPRAGVAEVESLCRDLCARPDVVWAEPDWVVRSLGEPSNPEFNRQWNLRAIGATSAWDLETGDEDVVVAVVDSGLVDHPDLAGRVVPGYDFVSNEDIAADGDGRDDDPTDPGDRGATSGLSVWHGTHVASIIVGNGGMRGVAPGCRVMMLRALGVGGGYASDAADAILFAAGLASADGRLLPAPVRVVNLSIGLDQDSTELRQACEAAANRGCFLVAAVGNDGGAVVYPAAYPSTFAVAAVDGKLLTTSYSSFGDEVDLAAPGGGSAVDQWNDGWPDGVLGAVRDETVEPAVPAHGYLVGTSQAAPHVAGAAALLLSLDASLQSADLAAILRASALDLGQPGHDVAYGAGLLQVHEAAKLVMERKANPVTTAPALLLPTRSVQFEGLRTSLEIPLLNGGGGTMNVFFSYGQTDDGADWLSGVLQEDTSPSAPVNMRAVRIDVDRSRLSTEPGRYAGTLLLGNSQGVRGAIRVVVYVRESTRAGEILPVVAVEDGTGIARRKAHALPEFGYRYWFRQLPASRYRLQAGEDRDRDGFFCESGDACGWLGGATEMDAAVVEFVPDAPAVRGLTIDLR